ncbi:PREDICTED: pre-mRNA-splicing factor cwc22-like [Erythranthe guttata]|uniref:pre-mRNA-splicing factor cwc22-like n=1 Tax=Erythranthe guttata TaxID=4155 RepID=UPI00064DE9E7|nr:PREDICTED: pre-mRNA-splicing factor cwc22-like [Erythranthe guttata]|eukprot:XP_012857748.1 PREDICTED: pre-mRNA-splicing factor cwc22-like [Erythranthe guttata]
MHEHKRSTTVSSAVYVPPFKWSSENQTSGGGGGVEYQKRRINGLMNKANPTNIKNFIIPALLAEDLTRGSKGLFCRSCIKSQVASPIFTPLFAALVAAVNSKFPETGLLLLRMLALQFWRAHFSKDRRLLSASVRFVAHLVNQRVVNEAIAFELLLDNLLFGNPSLDCVEVAVCLVRECGSFLLEASPTELDRVFARLRTVLAKDEMDNRVRFMIEELFALRMKSFEGQPAVVPELNVVDNEEQWITHRVSVADEIEAEVDAEVDEDMIERLRALQIANFVAPDKEEQLITHQVSVVVDQMGIVKDETEKNLIHFRRSIQLAITDSVDYEEAGNKLLGIIKPGEEMELCTVFLECCGSERNYRHYYALLGHRLCAVNEDYQAEFQKCFVKQYQTVDSLDINKMRNLAMLLAHLLAMEALTWRFFRFVPLTVEGTTSSSRVFLKILFQELSEFLEPRELNERLTQHCSETARYAVELFDYIGLRSNAKNLRQYFENMEKAKS